jgi:hypothetical protein
MPDGGGRRPHLVLAPAARALKKAILHRKNALFYKTQNGARVGDLFMSLVYTCQLKEANPFDYLTQLQRRADQVAASPELWMPWNYRAALTQTRVLTQRLCRTLVPRPKLPRWARGVRSPCDDR